MRTPNDIRPIEALHLLINKGGLGDSIARLPAIKYVLTNYPHVKLVRLFVQDYFVEYANFILQPLAVHTSIDVYPYSKMAEIFDKYPEAPGMMVDSQHHTTLRTHLTDHAFHTLVDIQPEQSDKDYLQADVSKLPIFQHPEVDVRVQPYVVVTTGFTAPVREFLPAHINAITAYIKASGYQVVFLGQRESVYFEGTRPATEATFREEVDFSVGVDLRDKTSLLEATKLLSGAAAVVGLDNGLLHLAATARVNLPIVAGYTTVKPEHRMPYRNGQLGYLVYPVALTVAELGCIHCQSQQGFVYNTDFRLCKYGDYRCVVETTPGKYIAQLKQVLPKRNTHVTKEY